MDTATQFMIMVAITVILIYIAAKNRKKIKEQAKQQIAFLDSFGPNLRQEKEDMVHLLSDTTASNWNPKILDVRQVDINGQKSYFLFGYYDRSKTSLVMYMLTPKQNKNSWLLVSRLDDGLSDADPKDFPVYNDLEKFTNSELKKMKATLWCQSEVKETLLAQILTNTNLEKSMKQVLTFEKSSKCDLVSFYYNDPALFTKKSLEEMKQLQIEASSIKI